MGNRTSAGYAGADWVLENLKYEEGNRAMSPLGINVANLLGDWARGIYHLDRQSLMDVNWENDYWVEFVMNYRRAALSLCTIDFSFLTDLVVLSHDRCLRVEIEPMSHWSLKFIFHQRQRGDNWARDMPTMEDHLKRIRTGFKDEFAKKTRLCVFGSRSFDTVQCADYMDAALKSFVMGYRSSRPCEIEIVHGGTPGADALAGEWSVANGYGSATVFEADWKTHGKAAGPIRNSQMVEYANYFIGFWDGRSTGTKDMIGKVEKSYKPLLVFNDWPQGLLQ